jgi:hypothetical protein
MTNPESMVWKDFLRKHWGILAFFLAAVVVLFVGAIYVFRWFTDMAQSSGLVPSSLGLWTIGNLVWFIIYLILWELLIIGIPTVVGGVGVWQWWKRLPDAERMEYRFGKRSRTTKGGGGGSFLFFIVFCIKVYLDRNWNVPIATWTINYVVDSVILILILGAIILGIPGAIVGFWWLRREMKRP